jgi:hypothetical protein
MQIARGGETKRATVTCACADNVNHDERRFCLSKKMRGGSTTQFALYIWLLEYKIVCGVNLSRHIYISSLWDRIYKLVHAADTWRVWVRLERVWNSARPSAFACRSNNLESPLRAHASVDPRSETLLRAVPTAMVKTNERHTRWIGSHAHDDLASNNMPCQVCTAWSRPCLRAPTGTRSMMHTSPIQQPRFHVHAGQGYKSVALPRLSLPSITIPQQQQRSRLDTHTPCSSSSSSPWRSAASAPRARSSRSTTPQPSRPRRGPTRTPRCRTTSPTATAPWRAPRCCASTPPATARPSPSASSAPTTAARRRAPTSSSAWPSSTATAAGG